MSSDKPRPSLERVKLASISPGPILRDKLTDGQLEAVRSIFAVVEPYVPSFDDFELGFRRDADPDSELLIWSGIAMAYQRFKELYPAASEEEQGAAFTSVVLLMSNEETPSSSVPELIWNRCKDIVRAIPVSGAPITVFEPRRQPK